MVTNISDERVSDERRTYQNVPAADIKEVNMGHPLIKKGFSISERMGKSCPGLASFFKGDVAYFTKGDTNMTM